MSRRITCTIITLNEEANIADAVASALRVCDEVVVVDSDSTDRTREIAEKAGARVFLQPYLGDGPQKRVGVQYAKNDWIFSLDADERFDESGVRAVLALDLDNTPYARFTIRRKTFVGSRWIKIWYPDTTTRLYRKDLAGYSMSIGHASVEGGRLGELDGDLLHYSYKSWADLVARVPKFAVRGAVQLRERSGRPATLSPVFHGLARFFKHYIVKRGFLLGLDGLTISLTSAYVVYMKYAIAVRDSKNDKGKGG